MKNWINLLMTAVLTHAASAQTCIYTSSPDPSGAQFPGSNPSDPFLSSTQPPWNQPWQRIQILIPESVFQNVPSRITDMAFGVRYGMRVLGFSELVIRMGQTSVTTLSQVFSLNISTPLQDVLVVKDHTWQQGFGPDWVALGLQQSYQFLPGQGRLLIEIVARNRVVLENIDFGLSPSGVAGTNIAGGGSNLPLVSTTAVLGMPAIRFCVDRAETSLHGTTCTGSGTSTPLLGVSGRPTPGSAPTVWLSDAPANSLAACAFGFDNRAPFPLDLTAVGAPGCRQYFSIAYADFVATDPLGVGQRAVVIPNSAAAIGSVFYAQYFVLDPPANALDLTASNYARMLVGL